MATKQQTKIAKIGKEASKRYKASKAKGSKKKYLSFVKEVSKEMKK